MISEIVSAVFRLDGPSGSKPVTCRLPVVPPETVAQSLNPAVTVSSSSWLVANAPRYTVDGRLLLTEATTLQRLPSWLANAVNRFPARFSRIHVYG